MKEDGETSSRAVGISSMKRKLAWLLGLLAYFGPTVWAFFAIESDHKSQLAGHGWVCGVPMIGIVFLASVSSGVLSLAATGFGIAAFRESPKLRTWLRIGELTILALPLLLGVGFVVLLFCA